MRLNYSSIRNAYYIGIMLLVLYALPKITLVQQYIYPMLEYEFVAGMPVISIVSILTGIGAFMAYRYRKIG